MNAIIGAWLRTVLAVDEKVAIGAHVSGRAHKDARVHICRAGWADDAKRMPAHVDFTRDINHTPLSEGEFTPGVGSLAVDELSIGIDGGPSTGGTVGE